MASARITTIRRGGVRPAQVAGLLAALLGVIFTTSGLTETLTDKADAYYRGKRVVLLIGTTPGSGADLLARVIARSLPRFVPGAPTVISQNMPGAGSVTMMNHLYNVAERDGTIMGMVVGGLYMRHLLDAKGIRHDLARMIPIYNPEGGGTVIYAGLGLGLKNARDIVHVKREITFGYQSPEGNSAVLGQAGFSMLAVPYRGISGYKGSHDVSIAVERGELDAGWNTPSAYRLSIKPKVDAGLMVPVFQSGLWRPRDNAIVPDSSIPEVPTFGELYRQVKMRDPSGPLWDAWFMPLISATRYTIFFPPAVAAPANYAMTTGLERMCADAQFQADVRRVEVAPTCYLRDEARAITMRSSQAPAEAIDALRALLKR